jgi:hypothetical protein
LQLQPGETFIIPIVSLGVLRHYHELAEASTGSAGDTVAPGVQAIQFRLDESGASLKSYGGYLSDEDYREGPRKFIFDKPFLLYLVERKSKNPYLAMWIANEEVLELAPSHSPN